MAPQINIPHDKIADFCRKHRIKTLSLFGSVLRDDFQPESDVDVLVEFDSDVHVGYIGLARIEEELSRLLGNRTVDFVNPKYLNKRIRRQVLNEAEVQYAEK